VKVAPKPWTARNRLVSALRNEHVRVAHRPGVGRGLFAKRGFVPGDYVASYQGRVIRRAEVFALTQSDVARFERISEYAIATPSGDHLFEDSEAPGAHLINHSCGPNTIWAGFERGAMLVRATRAIADGEEITIHYGWTGTKAAKEKSWHVCACGAPFCTGTIELRVEWVDEPEGSGTWLDEEEMARRFLADIVNDTDQHETVLLAYPKASVEMAFGAEVVSPVDPGAFLDKLEQAAQQAVDDALRWAAAGKPMSHRRLRQIVSSYHVPIAASALGS
jgi:hypothetical protein